MSKISDSIFKERKINLLPNFIQEIYYKLLNPVVSFLIKREIHPNLLTTFGLLLSISSAVLLAKGCFSWAGLSIMVAGTCDVIDGKVARATGLGSKFGALYDSAIDRYSEVIMFLGVFFYFVANGIYTNSIAVFIAISGSLMVSYIRARAEGLGVECRVGIMQRAERIVFLAVGALFGDITFVSPSYPISLIVVIWFIAIGANFTAVQRLYYVWKETNNLNLISKKEKKEEGLKKQDI